MSGPMRIILLTGDDLEHRYVANRLSRELPLSGIIVDHGKPLTRKARIRQLYNRYTFPQLISRFCLAFVRRFWKDKDTREATLITLLGEENCLDFSYPELIQHVHGINTPVGQKAVQDLDPDVILVFGTGIIGNKVLSMARKLALNMHTGISPFYRGCDCTFWPVYNQEFHLLGATVHECTSVVDGGRVFGRAVAELQEDDNLFSVFARCVMTGTDLYVKKVLELIAGSLEGSVQDLSQGKEYRAYMRGFWADWQVRRNINAGMIRRYVQSADAARIDPPTPALSYRS